MIRQSSFGDFQGILDFLIAYLCSRFKVPGQDQISRAMIVRNIYIYEYELYFFLCSDSHYFDRKCTSRSHCAG